MRNAQAMANISAAIEDMTVAAAARHVLAGDAARCVCNIEAPSVEAKEKAAAARERRAKLKRGDEIERGLGKRADQAAIMRAGLRADLCRCEVREACFESLLPRLRQVRDCRRACGHQPVWRKGQRR